MRYGRIESFDHEVHRIVIDGDTVVTEHTATWHFHTGEVIPLPFVSIHVVRDGKFDLWRDYWDLTAWVAAAPQWWIEHIATAGAENQLRALARDLARGEASAPKQNERPIRPQPAFCRRTSSRYITITCWSCSGKW